MLACARKTVSDMIVHNPVTKISKAATESLQATIDKIVQFIKRYKLSLFTYTLGASIMLLLKVPVHYIAMSLIPGFLYNLFFTSGTVLPQDLLIAVPDSKLKNVYVPKNKNTVSGALDQRRKVHRKMMNKVSPPIHADWKKSHQNIRNSIIYGPSGVGKTAFLTDLAQELKKKHKVFILNIEKLSSGGGFQFFNGNFNSLVVRTYLNTLARFTKRPPVLIIDDGEQIMAPNGTSGLGNQSKDKICGENKYITILSMVTPPKKLSSSWQEIYRRFDGNSYELKPLDKEGIIRTINEVKASRLETPNNVKISDEVVKFTVDKVIESTSDDKTDWWLDRSFKVLTNTVNDLYLKAGPNAKVSKVTTAHVKKAIKNQDWSKEFFQKN